MRHIVLSREFASALIISLGLVLGICSAAVQLVPSAF